MEKWKPIFKYELIYEISNKGNVRRSLSSLPHDGTYPGRRLKPSLVKGYYKIGLHKEGTRKMVFVHRLVAEAFIPNTKSLLFVNHKDINKQNNDRENLEWCTSKQNSEHAQKLGLYHRGEKLKISKLTEEKIREIRKLWKSGKLEQKEIAKQFDVSPSLISAITLHRIWKHVD